MTKEILQIIPRRKTDHDPLSRKGDRNPKVIPLIMFIFTLVSCNNVSDTRLTEEIENDVPASTTMTVEPQDTRTAHDNQGIEVATGSKELETNPLALESTLEEFAFAIQPGSPVAIKSWTHDCNWSGVGGQVFYDGNPVNNLIVETGGTLAGEDVLGLSITGLVSTYGSGGYEIQLADQLIESEGTVWIQLKDITGLPLSPKYVISSHDDCAQNLILVNFVKSEFTPVVIFYYPVFFR
jgi:hypothetical protein